MEITLSVCVCVCMCVYIKAHERERCFVGQGVTACNLCSAPDEKNREHKLAADP